MRLAKCPLCGEDKWAYIGTDLPWEPPCAPCTHIVVTRFEHVVPARFKAVDSADPNEGREPADPVVTGRSAAL